jgi:hypothetical protein
MLIIACFTSAGVPQLGLSPTIDVWNANTATHDVSGQPMAEIDGGFYSYAFAGYDATKDYTIRCDGTSALPDSERYSYSTNEVQKSTDALSTLITRVLGLSQENFRMMSTTYVANKLTDATLKTYPSAIDANADTNAIASYTISATYDGNGDCDSYKVVKI